MHRLLTILLLLLLPLQFSWAAAASYCQHVASYEASGHFGHHEHQHAPDSPSLPDADAFQAPDGTKSAPDKLVCLDDDCGICHFGCGKTVGSTLLLLDASGGSGISQGLAVAVGTPRPAHIDRPNWRAG